MKERLVLALLIVGTGAHADDLSAQLEECSAIDNDAARVACYDGLVTDQAPEVPDVPAAAQDPEAEVATVPAAPASLGAERMPQKDRASEVREEPSEYLATVTRCDESADGRYIFFFDNEQVWKQSNADGVYFRDCSFDVTIRKDFFGYKMQLVGEKRRIRIKRLR